MLVLVTSVPLACTRWPDLPTKGEKVYTSSELQQLIGIAGVPVIVALVQVLKPWIKNADTYPLISCAMGVALNMAIAYFMRENRVEAAAAGIIAGLAASGLYEVGRQYTKPKPTPMQAQIKQEDL